MDSEQNEGSKPRPLSEDAPKDKIRRLGKRDSSVVPDKESGKEEKDWVGNDKTLPYRTRKTIFNVVQASIWIFFSAGLIVLVVLLYHKIAPECARWLNATEIHSLSDILTLITGGAIGAFISKYFKRVYSDLENDK